MAAHQEHLVRDAAPDDGYRFDGRGSGHGVGMCVIGSTRLAARGQTARAILTRYFPGTTIEPMREDTVPASVTRRAPAPVATPAPRAPVQPAAATRTAPRPAPSTSMPAPAGISKRSCPGAGSSWQPR